MSGFSVKSGKIPRVSRQTIEGFQQQVADPGIFCGGGTVAAVTASSAASLVLLVVGLNARRKSNSRIRADLEEVIARAETLQGQLLAAADADLQALDSLLNAQRAMRQSGDRAQYQAALLSAAATPLAIARDALELLRIVDQTLNSASRFTVSDLGAAAVLALGALQAATMMSEVNLALLDDEDGSSREQIDSLDADVQYLVQQGRMLAHRVDERIRVAIRRDRRAETK